MDTSKKYIDMCREAIEIQALRPIPKTYSDNEDYTYTSFFYLPEYDRIRVLKWDNDECHPIIGEYHEKDSNAIWLPRQDQLQELSRQHLDWYDTRETNNLCLFWDWGESTVLTNEVSLYHSDTVSLEILWLAYTMHSRFHKTWNGKNWISIS